MKNIYIFTGGALRLYYTLRFFYHLFYGIFISSYLLLFFFLSTCNNPTDSFITSALKQFYNSGKNLKTDNIDKETRRWLVLLVYKIRYLNIVSSSLFFRILFLVNSWNYTRKNYNYLQVRGKEKLILFLFVLFKH